MGLVVVVGVMGYRMHHRLEGSTATRSDGMHSNPTYESRSSNYAAVPAGGMFTAANGNVYGAESTVGYAEIPAGPSHAYGEPQIADLDGLVATL